MRGWRLLSGVALLLAAASVLLSAKLFTRLSDQQDSINQSRVDVAYLSCKEQNGRHDKTLARLDKLIEALPPGAERRRAQRNLAGTKALIEALAPHQNCLTLVRQRFGSGVTPE